MTQLKEAVVRDVHHVVDGTQANGRQAVRQPLRGGADLHAVDLGSRVQRAHLRGGERDEIPRRLGLRSSGRGLCGVRLQRAARDARQLASHAPVAQQVRAVRGNLQLKNGVRGHEIAHGRADFVLLWQDPEPVLLVRQTELGGGAEHAVAGHAAQLALLDLPAAGQDGPGQGAGHFIPHLVILRTADDLTQGTLAGVHLAAVQVVAALHRGFLHHSGHHHGIRRDAALVNPLHLNPREGEHIRHLACAESLQVNVSRKPV